MARPATLVLPDPGAAIPDPTSRPLTAMVLACLLLAAACTDTTAPQDAPTRADGRSAAPEDAPAPDASPAPDTSEEFGEACDDEVRTQLVTVVDGQLDAIGERDWDRALDHATESFRAGVDADRFRQIILDDFPVVAAATARDAGRCAVAGDEATMLVTVEDGDGAQQSLLYLFEREAEGWGIGGAVPAPGTPDEGTVTA